MLLVASNRPRAVYLLLRLISAMVLALGLGIAAAGTALADCDAVMPSFHDYAPSTKLVVIGDVTAVERSPWQDAEGRSSRFTLRVSAVLRGRAPAVMRLRDIAYSQCADHKILVAKGDRIALALNGVAFTPPVPFSTIAWIRGRPGGWFGVETTTEADVLARFRSMPPNTATAPGSPRQDGPPFALIGLPGVAAWFLVVMKASRHGRRPARRRI